MRARRLSSTVMLVSVAIMLAACTSNDDATSDPENNGQPPAAPGVTEPAPEPDVRSAPEGANDCSASGQSVTVLPADGLDPTVRATRDFLIDAALRCDDSMLITAIDESSLFSFSFGDDTDPLAYWWALEDAGEQPFLRLAQVLSTTPALADGGDVVVFPRVTTGRPEDTTDEAIAELFWIDDERRVTILGDSGYLDWRAGIALNGEWRFFVAGD